MTAPAARENLRDVLMCAAPIQERYKPPRTAEPIAGRRPGPGEANREASAVVRYRTTS